MKIDVHVKQVFLILCLLVSFLFAGNFDRGITTSSFMERLTSAYSRGKVITLPLPNGKEVSVEVTFYSFKDGYLSLKGVVTGNPKSECILKVTKDEVYGWIQISAEPIESGIVYLYQSDANGRVTVKDARVTDILSISPEVSSRTSNGKDISYSSPYRADELPPIVYIKPTDDNVSINELQSKPESKKVIWLDIRDIMNGEEPIAYSREEMIEIWQVVANGLSMYDVNVTTDISVFSATPSQNRGIGLFHNREGRSHCSYKGFGTEGDCEIYLKSNGFFAGRTALHEYGHLLGVLDMGTGLNGVKWKTYFEGYSDLKWVPIMGNFLYSDNWGEETLMQWSNGEYEASNGSNGYPKEDQLSIMAGYINRVPDDIPTSKSLHITNGTVSMVDNYGMINVLETGSDTDEFTFDIVGSKSEVNLTIDRIGHIGGSMLDVHAVLLDNAGNTIAEDNQQIARYATIKEDLDPGSYTLRISGGTEEFSGGGFSNYGSIGYYGIYGTVDNGVGVLGSKKAENGISISSVENQFSFSGLGDGEKALITVYNALGRIVFERQIIGSATIDFQNSVARGCYYLRVTGARCSTIERFTIAK